MWGGTLNKITSQRKTHAPPWRFLYLRETKSCWCGEGEEGEEEGQKVSLKTHATARGVGKKNDGLREGFKKKKIQKVGF